MSVPPVTFEPERHDPMGMYEDRYLEALRHLGPPGRWLADRLSDVNSLLSEGLHVQGEVKRASRAILGIVFIVRSIIRAEVTVRASSITYTFLFSLVPLLVTTLFVLAAVPGLADERANLESALFEYFLPGAAQAVQQYLEQFTEQAAAAGAVSSLIFFVITMLLLRSMESSLNVIWKAHRSRSVRELLEVLSLTFIVGALALTSLGAVSGMARSMATQVEMLGRGGVGTLLAQLGFELLELGLAWLVFTIATWALPNTRVRLTSAMAAGVVTGTAWHYLKGAFTWYVTTFPSYENIYGALGTIPVFLLWVYLSFLLLFACSSVAYVHQNLSHLIEQERMRQGQLYPMAYFATAVLAVLVERFTDKKTPARMTVQEMADLLEVEPLLVTQVLEPMLARSVVVEVEEDHGVAYMLGVSPDVISVRDVVMAAIGDPLAVPDHEAHIEPELRAELMDVFGAARVSRDSVLDAVSLAEMARGVRGIGANGELPLPTEVDTDPSG